MAVRSTSWIGRKERTHAKLPPPRLSTKSSPYACSHKLLELNSIVQVFSDKQKRLAESTGFRTFSRQMHDLEFDKQFTMWLMPKVDIMSRTISISSGKRLMMFQEDVSKVFGIPVSGKEVWDATLDKSQAMRSKIQETIGMDDQFNSPSAAATATLRSLLGREMSEEEEGRFKIAFIVFVIGLLCDSSTPGEVESTNFWPALKEPTSIHKFNWSSYVLESVFSACASAKMATRTNINYMPPAGTAMFLQIFFLDNMDYGDMSLPKSILPRVELYDRRILSKQIMAETVGLRGQTPCRKFGAGKLRSDDLVVYRRGLLRAEKATPFISPADQLHKRSRPPINASPTPTNPTPIELDPSMQALLAVKAHKARCIKILTLARKTLEEETDKLVDIFEKLKATTNKTSVAPTEEQAEIEFNQDEPFTPSPKLPGQSISITPSKTMPTMQSEYIPSFSLGQEFDDEDPLTSVLNTGRNYQSLIPISPLGPSPPRKTQRTDSPKSPMWVTKLRSGEYLFNKRSPLQINLNDSVAELEFTQTPISRMIVVDGKINCPPRDTSWPFCPAKVVSANRFFKWVVETQKDDNRYWIRHGTPKFIEISTKQIIEQFVDGRSFEPDTCDAMLRRFQQTRSDCTVYNWRHFLETDFAMRVIAGEDYLSSRSIQHQWVGKHIKADISKCMLIITLVLVDNKWSTFAWDMKRRQLTIHSPGNKQGDWDAHTKVSILLTAAIRSCIETFFDSWNVDWPNWATIYKTDSTLTNTTRESYDYGIEALFFSRTYDGVKQGGRLTANVQALPSHGDILFDLLHLQNNTGYLPKEFVQDLDD